MTSQTDIGTITASSSRVANTLALAFQEDPAIAWILPNEETRRRILPGMFKIMAEQSQRYGGVLASRDQNAAALLYPAGKVKDDGLWDTLRLLLLFKTALPRGLKVAEAMHAQHPNPQPHLYLRYLGVAPKAQGQGLGGDTLRAVINRASQQGKGVLLETANESNVSLYSRFGFEIASEWDVPGGGPHFWTMVRPAE